MKEKGMISDLSVESQRRYLDAHPEKWREIYGYCPSYVYFKVTSTPPLGSDSVPLTDNRSMATDRTIYSEKGLIGFVSAKRPTEDGKWKASNSETIGDRRTESQGKLPFRTFSRFFLDQDTGGAIRGRLRADLYFGEGDYAGEVAHSLKNYGDMYFLMLRR
jgi:membrane-bound lytic murein transglycosylase A